MTNKNKKGFKLVKPDEVNKKFRTEGLWFENKLLFGVIDLKKSSKKELVFYNRLVKLLNAFLVFVVVEIYLISYIVIFLKNLLFFPFRVGKFIYKSVKDFTSMVLKGVRGQFSNEGNEKKKG